MVERNTSARPPRRRHERNLWRHYDREAGYRLPCIDAAAFTSSLALLVPHGAVRDAHGILANVFKRSTKSGARRLLDRMGDL